MTDDAIATIRLMREHIQRQDQRIRQLELAAALAQPLVDAEVARIASLKRKRSRGAPKRHDDSFYGNYLAMVANAIEILREENSHKPNADNAYKVLIRPLMIQKRGRAGKIPGLTALRRWHTEAKKLSILNK
jgi:hypothetical protein